ILDTSPVVLSPEIMTTGEIPLGSSFESVAEGFFVEKNGQQDPDTLADDQALVLKTAKGTVVVLGCSHRGIINTLRHVSNLTGQSQIYAVLGGLHLVKATAETLETIMRHLQRFDLQRIVVGHCTGSRAIQALYARFKDKVVLNTVGHTFNV
ncbi:MAG: MBL fold metallo-hydrolase, partial [Deltaproteobacteria bacterium]|nr:MBL fold metallo-hydrolase [Deltaproteobacteria bacterium]